MMTLAITKTSKLFCLTLSSLAIVFSLTNCSKDNTGNQEKDARILKLTNDIKADSLENDVIWLQNKGTRFALANNRRNVAASIMNRFIQMGYADARLDSFYIIRTFRSIKYEQWQYNVVATIEGTVYPDSLCIIGGHYDNYLTAGDPFSTLPGANDNASGIAAVMEIARVMRKNNFTPQSTITFVAFGAEELGLYGSYNFALKSFEAGLPIRFMLNFDMIAYEQSADPSEWYVNIIDYDNSHSLRIDAQEMCTKYTRMNFINDNTDNKYSDSYPFFTYGYKALFFFSNVIDPNYHTLNDIAANCNFEYCCEIVKASCALLADKN
jgi:bacterial leucyl aminopeptidase